MDSKTDIKIKNNQLLRAALGQKTDYVPVWIMRQAGRYLPEFREIRSKHNFFELCRTPELASQVTLQPIKRFPLDAAIIFSDILVVPQALGMEIKMAPEIGPKFTSPLESPKDISSKLKYNINVYEDLRYVFDAIKHTKKQLNGSVPLIGFAGAPWTIMSYMIQGSGSKTFSKAKQWLYQYPRDSIRLLDILTNITIEYLYQQVKAGANMVQVFESHLGYLTPKHFKEFELPFLRKISTTLKSKLEKDSLYPVPIAIYGKDGHFALEDLGAPGYFDVVGIDWTISPKKARSFVHQSITLQGNLDPCALYAENNQIDTLVKDMITDFGKNRYIANLGHGIYPDTKPKAVASLVDAVHKYSNNKIS